MLRILSIVYWRFLINSRDATTRRRAAAELGKSRLLWAVQPLVKSLEKPIESEYRDLLSDILMPCFETGFLVDALVAIGPVALPKLINALDANSDFVRAGAASALGLIGDPKAVEPLAQAMRKSPSPVLVDALQRLDDRRAIPAMVSGLDPRFALESRKAAAQALQRWEWVPDDDASHVWFELLTWPSFASQGHQGHSAGVAERLRDRPRAFEVLADCLKERPKGSYSPPAIAERAAWVLGEFGDMRAVAPLAELLRHYQSAAAVALERLRAVIPLLGILREEKGNVKKEVVESLLRLGDPRAIPLLLDYVRSRSLYSKLADTHCLTIARGLGEFGEPGKVALRELLRDRTSELRELALRELLALNWQPVSEEDHAIAAFADPAWSKLPKNGELVAWVLGSDAPDMKKIEALASLGNVAVEPLLKHLDDSNALAALGRLADERAIKPLVDLYLSDGNKKIGDQALAALTHIGPLAPIFLTMNQEELSDSQRLRVIAGLSEFPYSMVELELSAFTRHRDEHIRIAAGDAAVFAVFKELLQNVTDQNLEIRCIALAAYAQVCGSHGFKPPVKGAITQKEVDLMQQVLAQIADLRRS